MMTESAELVEANRRAGLQAPATDSASVSSLAESAAARVCEDLNCYLESTGDPRRRIKSLAAKTGIHEKTLHRLSLRQNRPTYMTIFKIYRQLFSEQDDAKLLELVPDVVAQYLRRANPQTFEQKKTYSYDLEKELRANPIAAELTVLAATGPIKTGFVRARYGAYGMKVLGELIERRVVRAISHEEVVSGEAQINMAPETVVAFGLQMARSYLRPDLCYETGENFISFYAEGLSEAAYQKWLEIDAEAFQKKINLAKKTENHGDLRAFTFCATDAVPLKETK
jgi:hypothetical protein